MTDSALATFQTLCEKRECAAYQCAGAIKTALAFLTMGDAKKALDVMLFARADFDQCDLKVTEFMNSKKENTDGNRSAIA